MPRIVITLLGELLQWLALGMRSHTRLAAENLFLRKQLALYVERRIKPRRLDDATRLTLGILARFIEWRGVLTVVQPETQLRWQREGFACSGGGSHGDAGVGRFPSPSGR